MESPARRRLQIPFKELPIGSKFQMVNNVMKAAIPGSEIFKKIDDQRIQNGTIIRPDWLVEIVDS